LIPISRRAAGDLACLLVVVLLPVLVALPQVTGYLNADPALVTSGAAVDVQRGPVRGRASADPNDGFTTQALGYT
jgi:hypothetical protein